jgi:cytochrome c553/enamine deaminase RidA (YjgF/YER057c/UK114 family)
MLLCVAALPCLPLWAAQSETVPGSEPVAESTLPLVPPELVSCTTCHGARLQGNRSVNAPRLAGLPAWYLRQQLEAFRAGWRGAHPQDETGAAMRPQAARLDDAALARAVAFAAAVPAGEAHTRRPRAGDAARGEAIYRSCAACHGAGGEGSEALLAPPLAGLDGWYLLRQLEHFRAGARGAVAADLAGTRMRVSSTLLEDEQAVQDVVAYIATLPPALAGVLPSPAAVAVASLPTGSEDQSMSNTRSTPAQTAATGRRALAAASALALSVAAAGSQAEVRRHKLPNSDFPIAQAVEVLPGTTLVYHSGMTPAPANPEAERFSREFWGDTEAQTLSVFQRLEESLTAKGLTFGDVVKMQIFLVAPEPGGAMDFQGMMRAYRKYFGTEAQPNLPARSAFQVAGLAAPGMLVEIEVVLARP